MSRERQLIFYLTWGGLMALLLSTLALAHCGSEVAKVRFAPGLKVPLDGLSQKQSRIALFYRLMEVEQKIRVHTVVGGLGNIFIEGFITKLSDLSTNAPFLVLEEGFHFYLEAQGSVEAVMAPGDPPFEVDLEFPSELKGKGEFAATQSPRVFSRDDSRPLMIERVGGSLLGVSEALGDQRAQARVFVTWLLDQGSEGLELLSKMTSLNIYQEQIEGLVYICQGHEGTRQWLRNPDDSVVYRLNSLMKRGRAYPHEAIPPSRLK
jgi:hypothetical protein